MDFINEIFGSEMNELQKHTKVTRQSLNKELGLISWRLTSYCID